MDAVSPKTNDEIAQQSVSENKSSSPKEKQCNIPVICIDLDEIEESTQEHGISAENKSMKIEETEQNTEKQKEVFKLSPTVSKELMSIFGSEEDNGRVQENSSLGEPKENVAVENPEEVQLPTSVSNEMMGIFGTGEESVLEPDGRVQEDSSLGEPNENLAVENTNNGEVEFPTSISNEIMRIFESEDEEELEIIFEKLYDPSHNNTDEISRTTSFYRRRENPGWWYDVDDKTLISADFEELCGEDDEEENSQNETTEVKKSEENMVQDTQEIILETNVDTVPSLSSSQNQCLDDEAEMVQDTQEVISSISETNVDTVPSLSSSQNQCLDDEAEITRVEEVSSSQPSSENQETMQTEITQEPGNVEKTNEEQNINLQEVPSDIPETTGIEKVTSSVSSSDNQNVQVVAPSTEEINGIERVTSSLSESENQNSCTQNTSSNIQETTETEKVTSSMNTPQEATKIERLTSSLPSSEIKKTAEVDIQKTWEIQPLPSLEVPTEQSEFIDYSELAAFQTESILKQNPILNAQLSQLTNKGPVVEEEKIVDSSCSPATDNQSANQETPRQPVVLPQNQTWNPEESILLNYHLDILPLQDIQEFRTRGVYEEFRHRLEAIFMFLLRKETLRELCKMQSYRKDREQNQLNIYKFRSSLFRYFLYLNTLRAMTELTLESLHMNNLQYMFKFYGRSISLDSFRNLAKINADTLRSYKKLVMAEEKQCFKRVQKLYIESKAKTDIPTRMQEQRNLQQQQQQQILSLPQAPNPISNTSVQVQPMAQTQQQFSITHFQMVQDQSMSQVTYVPMVLGHVNSGNVSNPVHQQSFNFGQVHGPVTTRVQPPPPDYRELFPQSAVPALNRREVSQSNNVYSANNPRSETPQVNGQGLKLRSKRNRATRQTPLVDVGQDDCREISWLPIIPPTPGSTNTRLPQETQLYSAMTPTQAKTFLDQVCFYYFNSLNHPVSPRALECYTRFLNTYRDISRISRPKRASQSPEVVLKASDLLNVARHIKTHEKKSSRRPLIKVRDLSSMLDKVNNPDSTQPSPVASPIVHQRTPQSSPLASSMVHERTPQSSPFTSQMVHERTPQSSPLTSPRTHQRTILNTDEGTILNTDERTLHSVLMTSSMIHQRTILPAVAQEIDKRILHPIPVTSSMVHQETLQPSPLTPPMTHQRTIPNTDERTQHPTPVTTPMIHQRLILPSLAQVFDKRTLQSSSVTSPNFHHQRKILGTDNENIASRESVIHGLTKFQTTNSSQFVHPVNSEQVINTNKSSSIPKHPISLPVIIKVPEKKKRKVSERRGDLKMRIVKDGKKRKVEQVKKKSVPGPEVVSSCQGQQDGSLGAISSYKRNENKAANYLSMPNLSDSEDEDTGICPVCEKKGNIPCKCHRIFYCSQKCQEKHWTINHGKFCTGERQDVI